MKIDPSPGDLFEWVYKVTLQPVYKDAELYSSAMNKWVPCDGLYLCVGIKDYIIHWISSEGLVFYAYLDECSRRPTMSSWRIDTITPRKIEL